VAVANGGAQAAASRSACATRGARDITSVTSADEKSMMMVRRARKMRQLRKLYGRKDFQLPAHHVV